MAVKEDREGLSKKTGTKLRIRDAKSNGCDTVAQTIAFFWEFIRMRMK